MENVLHDPLDLTPETTDRPSLAENLTKVLVERNAARMAAQMAARAEATTAYGKALMFEAGLGGTDTTVAELEAAMQTLGLPPGQFAADVTDVLRFAKWSGPDFDRDLQEKLANELAQKLSAEAEAATAALRKAEADLEEVRGRTYRETSEAHSRTAGLGQLAHKRRDLGARLAALGVDVAGIAANSKGGE